MIDLAFLTAAWDPADAAAGLAQARDAYGKVAEDALKKTVLAMSERKAYAKRCTTGLGALVGPRCTLPYAKLCIATQSGHSLHAKSEFWLSAFTRKRGGCLIVDRFPFFSAPMQNCNIKGRKSHSSHYLLTTNRYFPINVLDACAISSRFLLTMKGTTMNLAERGKKMSELVAKCWADDGFKQKLLADPAATLKAEGAELPAGLTVKAVENTDNVFHLIIPAKPTDLSDEQLDQVAAGYMCWGCCITAKQVLDQAVITFFCA